jgi:hypothetical protein
MELAQSKMAGDEGFIAPEENIRNAPDTHSNS